MDIKYYFRLQISWRICPFYKVWLIAKRCFSSFHPIWSDIFLIIVIFLESFIFCWGYYTRRQKKVDTSKTEAFSLTVNISVNSLSNLTTKDSFGICFSWGFWNGSWLLNLIKNWWRYWQLKKRLQFSKCQLFFCQRV